VWETIEDKKTDSFWIGCAKPRCNWWVHTRCVHLSFATKKQLDVVAPHFFCPKHIPEPDEETSSDEEEPDLLKKGERLRRKVDTVKKERN
jgi:hypothetical protein